MSEANNIIFAQAKTSLVYHPKAKKQCNTQYLTGKEVRKTDEKKLVRFLI